MTGGEILPETCDECETTGQNCVLHSEGCGFSWDHTLRLIDEADGIKSYECTECGAEVVEDDD